MVWHKSTYKYNTLILRCLLVHKIMEHADRWCKQIVWLKLHDFAGYVIVFHYIIIIVAQYQFNLKTACL